MSKLFSYFYYVMSGEKKLLLREFEWFQVQTKVRQIMSDILQPLEKRVVGNTQSLSKLTEAAKVEAAKVQSLTLLLNDDPLIFEHGIFARIEQKFTDQRILIQQLAAKIDHAETYITSKGEIVDLRLAEATTAMSNLQQYKQFVSDELEVMRVNGEKSQHLFKDSFDSTNEDIAKAFQDIAKLRADCERIGLRTEQTEIQTHRIKNQVDEQISGFKDQLKNINLEHEQAVSRISSLERDLRIVGQLRRNSSKFQQIIKDFQGWIKNIEFKVEVIQPMLALSQTNDYLHHVLPAPFQPNLSVYFYNRYRTLLQEILANDFSAHRQKEAVSAGLVLVREVHKRSLKIAFQLKKEVLRKKGVDIDMLPHEKREEQLNNVQLEEHDVQMAPTLVDKPQKQPTPAPIAVTQLIADSLKEMADRLEAEIKDSKIYIQQMEEQLMKRVEDTEFGVRKVSKRVQQLEILSALEDRESRQRWGKNDQKIGEFGSRLGQLTGFVKDIFDSLIALSEIERQDERDRQGIMLLGVREQHKDDFKDVIHRRKETVELNRQCLSCSGNPNYYNQFFKMACLTYASSPVRLEGAEFERLDLIEKLQLSFREGKKRASQKKEHAETSEILSSNAKLSEKDNFNLNQNSSINRYDSQAMKLPSRQTQSASEILRKPSTSLQIKQGQESPRIILASELSHHLMSRNRARLFNRRGNESKSRREESSREKSEYMQTVSKQFRDLHKKNEEFIK